MDTLYKVEYTHYDHGEATAGRSFYTYNKKLADQLYDGLVWKFDANPTNPGFRLHGTFVSKTKVSNYFATLDAVKKYLEVDEIHIKEDTLI